MVSRPFSRTKYFFDGLGGWIGAVDEFSKALHFQILINDDHLIAAGAKVLIKLTSQRGLDTFLGN